MIAEGGTPFAILTHAVQMVTLQQPADARLTAQRQRYLMEFGVGLATIAPAEKAMRRQELFARSLQGMATPGKVATPVQTQVNVVQIGKLAAAGACLALGTGPTISTGVLSWSGSNCASRANNARIGSTCTITEASGCTGTSPGECGVNGKFAATGVC